ncbi:MAG: family 43 glycosylhydrolase [Bacteroidaceae bacterium]|nr:family 43 glycosylhydrolase [Bacteroidaceae bacterium]
MRLLTLLFAAFVSVVMSAQTPLTSPKKFDKNNPMNPFNFCADPTAVEYDGRVYVYGTNDQQQFDEGNGFIGGNDYGKINSLVCMSSADLVNWTWHAPIEVKKVAPWTGCSWAPSICSRVEADGLTHFYLYFANGASGIGVITSTSPTGPWKDPLGKVFIGWGHPGMGDIVWLFDPGVVVDENGTGWITWGGGGEPHEKNISKGANALIDFNTRIAKLGDDMCSIASDIVVLPAPFHFEASELNIIGSKFVYTYCSNWNGDRSMWSQFNQYDKSKAKPAAPGVAQMCYMTSTDPLNPDSWMYEGMYVKNPSNFGYPGGNNHTHLQKFNGGYYLFYHCQGMEKTMGSDSGKGGYRDIQVNKVTVDEEKCKISDVTMDDNGTTSLVRTKRPVITEKQQAEMIWNCAGIGMTYSGRGGSITAVKFKQAGSWTAIRYAYTQNEVKSFKANMRGKGKMEIRLDDVKAAPVGTIEYDTTSFMEYSISLTTPFKGSHTIYFVCTEATDGKNNDFDEWQFFEGDISAISTISNDDSVLSENYFTLSGEACQKPEKGLYIVKRNLANGQTITEKKLR